MRYGLVSGYVKHSSIMERLKPLATAFPSRLRLGVKTYLLGSLYPMCT